VTQAGTSTVQRYAIDGWNPAKQAPVGLEDFDVFAETNGIGSLTTRYVRGDNVDQLFGRVDATGVNWTLTDHLGSVRDVIGNNGTVKDSIAYDAYGNITSETNAANRGLYAWTGRELDVETGLQYNRARYYDAATGRWISQDPLGFDAGDSNLYRYVNNNPANASDPSGNLETPGFYRDYAAYLAAVEAERLRGSSQAGRVIITAKAPDAWRADRVQYIKAQQKAIRAGLEAKRREIQTALLFARMSKAAYTGEDAEVKALERDGFEVVGKRFNDPETGLQAITFRHKKSGYVILAFAGTDPKEWNDLGANAAQGVPRLVGGHVPEQYDQAIKMAGKLKEEFKDKLILTGHSLGGGTAAAAAIIHKIPAVTFNGAGVHDRTVKKYGADLSTANDFIKAYRVKGEPLSTIQDANWVGLFALQIPILIVPALMPDSNGVRRPIDSKEPWYTGGRHGIGTVIDGLERELADVNHQIFVRFEFDEIMNRMRPN
jgi:RHS repeat-associated protein